ncbi:MAG TPA: hypothetical protein VE978_01270 [Chitinophagales bacterium]|nr:hypothetical protein [Chitinophagales bacterium]
MKKALAIWLILAIPFLLSAQQKGNAQQDLQKQIEAMKQEMQSQIAALRDSIAMLQQQLRNEKKNPGYELFYEKPLSEKDQGDWMKLDSLLHDGSRSWSWSYSYPKVVPYDFQFMIPSDKYKDKLKWEQFKVPQCPEFSKHKHKHEWMKMLPFYHFFKS